MCCRSNRDGLGGFILHGRSCVCKVEPLIPEKMVDETTYHSVRNLKEGYFVILPILTYNPKGTSCLRHPHKPEFLTVTICH